MDAFYPLGWYAATAVIFWLVARKLLEDESRWFERIGVDERRAVVFNLAAFWPLTIVGLVLLAAGATALGTARYLASVGRGTVKILLPAATARWRYRGKPPWLP